ncbi:MAG TPA: hypothetical protein VK837_04940 [Longimicrobiales bacterium]|nr:hypothetical protein [Longimicrobiales bacterium]
MRRLHLAGLVLTAGLTASPAFAQEEGGLPPPLEIGAEAPDFELPGATRWGPLATPARLSDYRGKTVVLAFFFRARTKG